MTDAQLEAALDAAAPGVYRSSFDEIKEYYQDEYGARNWIGRLVTDLTGLTPSSGRPYKSARRRVERWSDGTNNPGKASRDALTALGEKLPPMSREIPAEGLSFTIKGNFYVSKKDGRRYREIEVHMDQLQALQFAERPSYEAIFEEYGVDGDMFAGGMEPDKSVKIA